MTKLTQQELSNAKKMSRHELMTLAQENAKYRNDILWNTLFDSYFPEKIVRSGLSPYQGFCIELQSVINQLNTKDVQLTDYSNSIRADKEMVIVALRQKGMQLEHVSEALRADKDVVFVALSSNDGGVQVLPYVSDMLDSIKSTMNLMPPLSIEQIGVTCGNMYRRDHQIETKSKEGDLCWDDFSSSEDGVVDVDICLKHLKTAPWSFQFMPKSARCNETIITQVLAVDGCAIQFVPSEALSLQLVLMAVHQSPAAIHYLPSQWRDDEQVKSVDSTLNPKQRVILCRKILQTIIDKQKKKLCSQVDITTRIINGSQLSNTQKTAIGKNITSLEKNPADKKAQGVIEQDIKNLHAQDFSAKKCVIGALQIFLGAAIAVAGVTLGVAAIATIIGGPSFLAIGAGAMLGLSLFSTGACKVYDGFFGRSKQSEALSNFLQDSKKSELSESGDQSETNADSRSFFWANKTKVDSKKVHDINSSSTIVNTGCSQDEALQDEQGEPIIILG